MADFGGYLELRSPWWKSFYKAGSTTWNQFQSAIKLKSCTSLKYSRTMPS